MLGGSTIPTIFSSHSSQHLRLMRRKLLIRSLCAQKMQKFRRPNSLGFVRWSLVLRHQGLISKSAPIGNPPCRISKKNCGCSKWECHLEPSIQCRLREVAIAWWATAWILEFDNIGTKEGLSVVRYGIFQEPLARLTETNVAGR
jgi:hypothetical protein